MKIRFIVDYRGLLTGERYYRAGDVADLDNATALVDEGRAEYVQPDPVLAVDLDEFSVRELRDLARAGGHSGYGSMKKPALVKLLRDD